MKRLTTLLLCHAIVVCTMAQSYEMSSVHSLTTQIEKWCDAGGGPNGNKIMSRFCEGFRSNDDLTMLLAERNDAVQLEAYDMNDYIQFLQNEINKKAHGFSIAYTNVKKLPADKLSNAKKGFDYYTCTVTTSGTFNYSCKICFS